MWFASEVAHQSHDRYKMSAWAAYGLIGYQASDLPWSPSLSYRFAYATGEIARRSATKGSTLSSRQALANWLQGVIFGKVTANANLAVHRLQFNSFRADAQPDLRMAPSAGARAQQSRLKPGDIRLSSSDIAGNQPDRRWAINRNLYLQTIGSVGAPGRALRDAGATKSWTTLQSSLYWTF